ncbi:MAG: hypothetical protein GY737_05185 [Desulfobacteraceae bacterium]|nr:hypothetical protein [Desulfobacteraceae bacterium]
MTNEYKLANQIKKEKQLAAIRQDVMELQSEQALDAILGSPMPASLVQSFPEQDLHFLMHKIGPADFLPVLAMASFDQWEYLLDVEAWEGDRTDLPLVTKNLGLLYKADPQRLVRWMIRDKTEFFEHYLFKNLELRIREHDEDPADFPDDFQAIDDVFYVRFPEIPKGLLEKEGGAELQKAKEIAEELIMNMLNTVADMDLSVYQGVLLETQSVIPSEIEEEQFRLKTVRLAEKGFLPPHEAMGIYQPQEPGAIVPRKGHDLTKPLFGTDYPLPPLYHSSMMMDDTLFEKSIGSVDPDMLLNLQAEFASLVNRITSADRRVVREKQDLEQVVQKGCAYLSLGMEIIHGEASVCTPADGAAIIARYRLEDLFRTGSWAGMTLNTKARQWHENSWLVESKLPLSFFDEEWLGLVGGLLLDRPLYFDNYRTGVLYRAFSSVSEIRESDENLDRIIGMDRLISRLNPDLTSFVKGVLTFKSLLLTLWARNRLGLSFSLAPIELTAFVPFFTELFSGEERGIIDGFKREDFILWLSQETGMDHNDIAAKLGRVFKDLFDWLEDEYGAVSPQALDPRFVTSFFLKE